MVRLVVIGRSEPPRPMVHASIIAGAKQCPSMQSSSKISCGKNEAGRVDLIAPAPALLYQ